MWSGPRGNLEAEERERKSGDVVRVNTTPVFLEPSEVQAMEMPAPIPEKNAAAVALGRLGGLRGGRARASRMTAEERAASARKAALARWGKL